MPTYEYRCPSGHHFELFQKMSEEPRAACPECGSESERVISGGAGFLFKGEGFYITDYRSEDYKKAAEKETGSGEEKAASDSGRDTEKSTVANTPAPKTGKKGGRSSSSTTPPPSGEGA